MMNDGTLRPGRNDERECLTDLWLRSVRATHDFVSEADIQSMLPMVRDTALPNLDVWVLADADDRPMGMIGMSGNSVEMLFVDPADFRRGCGRRLLAFAQSRHATVRLDVNEQNAAAHAFYLSQGYRVVGRSEFDGQGRPYPLLHMERQG